MDGLWKQKLVMQMEENRLMEITPQELAQFDGKDGRPAYVAVNKVVYDMTDFPSWEGGLHFGILAGTDATEDFNTCHAHTILEMLSPRIVGRLVE